ncbi:hypothetical protein QBC37DRAFT_447527 [Rhypophila decipiens]|uniref:Thioredoxin domain-containing protein n=1 Tax=Rhypophila decipiens TaxID=261697 RepID=A0AAN6Y219_9PEZI|nr:hypothetical protein QBC37DRAFT_447527 [Rhypophila decipiens]
MWKTSLLQLLISAVVSWVNGWQHASEAELVQAVKERTKPLLVAYLFSNEKSSQNLISHWARVENAVQQQQIEADVMNIDCSGSLSTCLELDVKAYPAIRLYHPDGRVIRYRGPRKSIPILAFLQRVTRPVLSLLVTTHKVVSFLSSDEIVFTAEFTPSETLLYEAHYRQLAERYYDQYSFGLILSSPPSKQKSQTTAKHSISKIKCHNAQTNDSFTLTSTELPFTSALQELLTQCTVPLIYEPIGRKQLADLATFSASNAKSGVIVHFFVTSDSSSTEDSEDTKELYKKEIAPLAKKYSQDILFTIIDGDEHPGMGPAVGGLPSNVRSGVSVENTRTGELFPYPRKYKSGAEVGKKLQLNPGENESMIAAMDELERFLGQIVEGKVKPWNGKEHGGDTGREGGQTGRHDEL